MWMDLNGQVAVQPLIQEGLASAAFPEALNGIFGYPVPLIMFLILSLVFIATTYDSASYCIASAATRGITPTQHPAKWQRVFWAIAIALLPIALVLVGELWGAQSIVLIVSLPLLLVGVLMVVSLMRSLRQSENDSSAATAPNGLSDT